MNKLYLISKSNTNETSIGLLEKAAKTKNIEIINIHTDEFDFSYKLELTADDGIYNLSDDLNSQLVEKSLLNSKVKSFYKDYRFGIYKVDDVDDSSSYLIFSQNNLPAIPSIISIAPNSNKTQKYVDELGGFPIIVKEAGKSHGEGVHKVDTIEELNLLINNLTERKSYFMLRKYISHTKQARIIVLGDKVIATHTNLSTTDFRTNFGENENRRRELHNYDQSIYDIAVKAVNSLGFEFGAVDILFDENTNDPFIAEVNFPCYFPRTQELTGINIAEAMIDFLINK